MPRKGFHRGAAIVGVAGWMLAALAGPADAQERVRWKLASSYASTLDVLGQNIIRVSDNIEAMSDGNFTIQFNEPVEIACNEANLWVMDAAEASQGEALAFHESQAWQEVAEEEAAADPRFKEVYDHYTAFREEYARWREVGYLKE